MTRLKSTTRNAAILSAMERVTTVNGLSEGFEFHRRIDKQFAKDVLLRITKDNMESIYNSAGSDDWVWSDEGKLNELTSPLSQGLVYYKDSEIVGFIIFRFEINLSLYIYEFQINKNHIRKGNGKLLFNTLLNLITNNFPFIKKIELTVLVNNTNAVAFYRAIGFSGDITSPTAGPYRILSRLV